MYGPFGEPRRFVFLLLVCLLVSDGPAAWSQESEPAGEPPDATGTWESLRHLLPSIHGYSLTSYRGRWSGGDEDNDLYEYFSISMEDLIPDRLDAELSFRLYEDFSETGSPLSFDDDIFIDIDDARDKQFPDRIQTGWADLHDVFREGVSLRVGRQYLYEFDGLHIDGARLAVERVGKFDFKGFLGRPVTYFSGTHGDSSFGFSSTMRATKQTKFRAKYFRYSDDSQNLDDDQAEVEFWHREGRWAYFYGSLNSLNSDLKDLNLSAKLISTRWDAYLVLRVYRLLSEISDASIEFSPFFAVLDELEPFSRSDIRLTKRIGERWDVFGGVSIRREDAGNDGDGDSANSDYERYDTGFTFYPSKKLHFTATGQYWDVDSGRRFTGVTSEIGYRPIKELRLTAGNSYGEYRNEFFDSFRQQKFRETPDVLTYFGSVSWRFRENTTLRTRFEVEDNDVDNDLTYSLQTSVGIRF